MLSKSPLEPAATSPATDRWENEGGLLVALSLAAPPLRARSGKREEDTATGCRAKAAADQVRAEALDGDQMRWRMERSAAAWTARAETLEMIERKAAARRRAAAPAVVE